MPFQFVLGTHNLKKGAELSELLSPHGIAFVTLAEVNDAIEVEEDGSTFAENACKKASEQAVHLKQWVLAEDSGLCVDALKGSPGIYSARYSGEHATDALNNQKLLEELANTPKEKRSAHYRCHVALSNPQGEIQAESSGICRGRIRTEPVGENGFGYDPLFEIVEYHKTFGELDSAVKRAISHRARAMRAIVSKIVSIAHNH